MYKLRTFKIVFLFFGLFITTGQNTHAADPSNFSRRRDSRRGLLAGVVGTVTTLGSIFGKIGFDLYTRGTEAEERLIQENQRYNTLFAEKKSLRQEYETLCSITEQMQGRYRDCQTDLKQFEGLYSTLLSEHHIEPTAHLSFNLGEDVRRSFYPPWYDAYVQKVMSLDQGDILYKDIPSIDNPPKAMKHFLNVRLRLFLIRIEVIMEHYRIEHRTTVAGHTREECDTAFINTLRHLYRSLEKGLEEHATSNASEVNFSEHHRRHLEAFGNLLLSVEDNPLFRESLYPLISGSYLETVGIKASLLKDLCDLIIFTVNTFLEGHKILNINNMSYNDWQPSAPPAEGLAYSATEMEESIGEILHNIDQKVGMAMSALDAGVITLEGLPEERQCAFFANAQRTGIMQHTTTLDYQNPFHRLSAHVNELRYQLTTAARFAIIPHCVQLGRKLNRLNDAGKNAAIIRIIGAIDNDPTYKRIKKEIKRIQSAVKQNSSKKSCAVM